MKVVLGRVKRILVPVVVLMGLLACGGVRPAGAQSASAQPVGAQSAGAQPAGAQQDEETPRLVVMLVVDQLSGALLERYEELFTGGLRRLLDGGMRFTRATHDHAQTSTAPGHATLGTGVYPTRHGIVGNSWTEYDPQGRPRVVYGVSDLASPILGDTTMEGRSPANMFRTGLASWMQEADANSRMVSLSKKDRSAIGMMAKARGDVFWLDAETARFVTSTYYFDEYPDWVRDFNEQVMPVIYADTIWESAVPTLMKRFSRADTVDFEGVGVNGGSSFPHVLRAEVARPGLAFENLRRAETPLPDLAVLRIAQAALRELELGQRGSTDFLGVSFSQTDIIGHAYGPWSREQLDNLLRLDERIGTLLDALDQFVGEGKWVLGFSADHGILPVPEYLDPPGTRISAARMSALFDPVRAVISEGLGGAELQARVIEVLEDQPEVADAMAFSEINGFQAPPDSFAVLFSRSFNRDRLTSRVGRLGVQIRWAPNVIVDPALKRGTTHGSPYYYDRWVPLIFYGAGVEPGTSAGPASTVDLAPTLAELAGVAAPDDLDGRVLVGGN